MRHLSTIAALLAPTLAAIGPAAAAPTETVLYSPYTGRLAGPAVRASDGARWKITRLMPNPAGTLVVAALNGNGEALTAFYSNGEPTTLGAWAGRDYFRTFNYCESGWSTVPTALGVGGWDVGYCSNAPAAYAYVREPNGVVATIPNSGASYTIPTAVQNGVIVGSFVPSTGYCPCSGFIYNVAGNSFQVLNPPGSIDTRVSGINAQNVIWGWYQDVQNQAYGFTYQNGAYTLLNQAGYSYLIPTGVNASGLLAGDAVDASYVHHAFVQLQGIFVLANLPNAYESNAVALNNAGQVAGNYTTTGGVKVSFLWSTVTNDYALLNAPARSDAIGLSAINLRGQVAGSYQVGHEQIAFVATCKGALCK
jgi:uncharacterized membrane protein